MRQLLITAVTTLVMLLATAAGASIKDLVGESAPDFALRSLQGDNLRLSEFRSEVVVLNFWSARCAKCRKAMPQLEAIQKELGSQGLHVIGIDIQGKQNKATALVAELGLSYPNVLDTRQRVSKLYDLSRLPAVLVIDREGTVRSVYNGYKKDHHEQLKTEISAVLAE